ncbi:MAG: chromate transporter [Tissierellia bacterium]|nr:chromate transporter [Tissierellia bacterium]
MYLDMLVTFAKIGVMTFGGGYAMLPIIQREIVERKHWVTEEEVLDYYAIGQSTPGVIAVNTATFVGYKLKGVLGAIACTVGVVLPSFIIISLLAGLITSISGMEIVQHAFAGIRVAVCALVTQAVVRLAVKSVKDLLTAIIALLAFAAVALMNISPLWIVVISIVFGLLFVKKVEQ